MSILAPAIDELLKQRFDEYLLSIIDHKFRPVESGMNRTCPFFEWPCATLLTLTRHNFKDKEITDVKTRP